MSLQKYLRPTIVEEKHKNIKLRSQRTTQWMQTKLVLPCPVLVAACDDLMPGAGDAEQDCVGLFSVTSQHQLQSMIIL